VLQINVGSLHNLAHKNLDTTKCAVGTALVGMVGMAAGCGMDNRGVRVLAPLGSKSFSTASRLALGPTQPPIQWVPGVLSLG
jgi:hypothetical protein